MSDYLARAIAKEAGIRGLACITTEMADETRRRHNAFPTATAALARAMTGGALMGALLKVQHRVAIKFEANGPMQKIVVEADSYGRVRGYTSNPEVDLPPVDGQPDAAGAVGDLGVLTVVKDLRLKELYEGFVPLYDGKVDTDLTLYLNQSEQIPSMVEIGALLADDGTVTVAGGLLIQALPPTDEAALQQIFNHIPELPPVEALLKSGKTPEDLLALVFGEIDYTVLEQRPLRFECQCSRERSEAALIALGREELEQLIATEEEAIIDCHFCHARYVFDQEELKLILEEIA